MKSRKRIKDKGGFDLSLIYANKVGQYTRNWTAIQAYCLVLFDSKSCTIGERCFYDSKRSFNTHCSKSSDLVELKRTTQVMKQLLEFKTYALAIVYDFLNSELWGSTVSQLVFREYW